ncbi:MAG: hypothetical protein ACRC8S_18845 [Fimbriiglobus sp.]
MSDLRRQGVPFTAYKLPDVTFGIFLRDCPAIQDPFLCTFAGHTTAWLRQRRLSSWVPEPLRPVARRVASWFRTSKSSTAPGT